MVMLVIVDGWGLGDQNESNPVHVVKPKIFEWLYQNFPVTSLQASGISIGLPWGAVGNSEVGHLTIGSGKVIYQYYPRITMAIRDGSFYENPALKGAFRHAKKNNSSVHAAGLLTEGTVHAALDHVLALVQMGEREGIPIKLHLYGDGKDGTPNRLQVVLDKVPKENIATVMGRYFGMDREDNWQLTQKAYDAMTTDEAPLVTDPIPIIQKTYNQGYNEGYVPPVRLKEDAAIKDGDSLIFFNFREDSIRQIAESFIVKDFNKFPTRGFKDLYVATMSQYKEDFTAPIAFPTEEIKEPLGKVISDAGLSQLRIGESYKYAHITYFFNGYIEQPFKGEYRVLIPSIKIPHVEEQPEMMASSITDRLVQAMESRSFNFVMANYANPDTIAHTGNYQASIEAVKVMDIEINRLVKIALQTDTILMITSDHGNIEEMVNPITGAAESQHDPNPVPFYLIAKEYQGMKFANWQNLKQETVGVLSDVAPTILEIMGIPQPAEMTGRSLLGDLI